jgi:hypothetical protein
MNVRYALVAERAGHRCEYCRAPELIFNFQFEIEHIIPPGHGGIDHEANWALSCRSCNLHKSNNIKALDKITGLHVTLFHPRQESWLDHFLLRDDTGTIEGLTTTGRATALLLRMNAPMQIAARRQWIRFNLFES